MSHLFSSAASQDSSLPANPTSSGPGRVQTHRGSSTDLQPLRRGIAPISTSHLPSHRPPSASGSPSRGGFSPTGLSFNHASPTVNRQFSSRQSSTSSTNSHTAASSTSHSNNPLHLGSRSRAVTGAGSPRPQSSLASHGPANVAERTSRLARHSPSLSHSTTGSPVSTSGSSGQLTSLLITQLNILLSTLKEDKDKAKWDAQIEKIRKLVDDNGMDMFNTYFRRLLQSNASTVFPGTARATPGTENAGTYQALVEEMQKIPSDPTQAEKIAQVLDTNDGELFRDFDLSTFVDHFKLNAAAKVALLLACRSSSKADLHNKADAILNDTWQPFFKSLARANAHINEPEDDISPQVLASIIERMVQDPPRSWEEQRQNLLFAIRTRYRSAARLPLPVQSAVFLIELVDSQDSRLVRHIQRVGPRATASLEAAKEMLATVETRDISYAQIANALLFMVIVKNGNAYDAAVFVEAVRQHRAGRQIDWTDVVQLFDNEHLRISKKQFLELYHALLPLAREYANFDIQTLWGGRWRFENTQLSFIVAFLSTTPDELDVMQIPNLRQAFHLTEFATASDSVRAFAEEAIKHPLVSAEATEALFTMIFRSQEAYNNAQILGIPDLVINKNMTIFVCAASAVPKPWAPLQDQALKQLFYPFLLKQHDNYDFVMHSLWQHDKNWIATRLVEFYGQNPLLLTVIFDHALEHNWLELLMTIQSQFTVDLATYAYGKGECDLEEWAHQLVGTMNPAQFAQAIADFLKLKMDDENMVQREHAAPNTVPLTVKAVHALLTLIGGAFPEEFAGPLYRQCLQQYPRLFNYGEDDKRDAIIDGNGENGPALSEPATKEMEERYKLMYGGSTTPDALVTDLTRLKASESPADQEIFAAMLSGLFEEYNCFGQYPNEALATTAVLLGGLVSYDVLSGIAQQAGIFMIFEAVTEYGPDNNMYRFGLQAILHILPRLKDWPHIADRILHTPSLRATQAFEAAESVLRQLAEESNGVDGNGNNGITNGVLEEELPVETLPPPFSAIQVDPPSQEDLYEEPDDETSDKVMFVLNNVSKRNLDEKFKEIEGTVEERYHQWLAHYLVEDLAKSQPNFQGLYLQLLNNFNRRTLWAEVLRETYASCQRMLNAQSTLKNPHERTTMKNLAGWLGSITLARNQPILQRNLSFKDLLIEGYETERLVVTIPFTCKTLVQAAQSKVFRPPNPWIEELLALLSELYHYMDITLNMKFEIEMLCREFDVDIKSVEPGEVIRAKRMNDSGIMQQYLPDGPPVPFGDMSLMSLSKRGPDARFSPESVIQAIPDLGGMLQIPPAAGNITQAQMRTIFVNAAQQAIQEIIAPVVERSVTIAAISTAELVTKDFATEGDEGKMRSSSHTMVKALSGSLALVTCKEPLRMSITNNIRILASRNLPEALPEGQIIMFVNDNIDTVCSLVERAAEDFSLAEIDLQLQPATDERRQHNEQRPNEPFAHAPISHWANLIPEPYRQEQHGLNRQQLALYEEFGRQVRTAPGSHANNASQDTNRQLPDVLAGENYLPNLPTPAEAPVMPRSAQQQRMPGGQVPPNQHQVNGYAGESALLPRVLGLLTDIQEAARKLPDDQKIDDSREGTVIRHNCELVVNMIDSAVQRDVLAAWCASQILPVLLQADIRKRQEIEIFVHLLQQMCRISSTALRNVTLQLATTEEMPRAVVASALLREGLIDVYRLDKYVAEAMENSVTGALAYFGVLIDELLLKEDSVTLRADFSQTYDRLTALQLEQADFETAASIMAKLRLPAHRANGMPSPQSGDKGDSNEDIFEEWLHLQRRQAPLSKSVTFVKQLHERHILSDQTRALSFMRVCIEMSTSAYERALNTPPINTPQHNDNHLYGDVDALAKLIVYITLCQEQGEGENRTRRSRVLDSLFRLIILTMNYEYRKQQGHWNGRVYFRLFSAVLCEIEEVRGQFSPQEVRELYGVFTMALRVTQPQFFEGFAFQWLSLVSHRLFVPAMLDASGRVNGGWNDYTRLLTTLFIGLGDILAAPCHPPTVQDYHKGILRTLTTLHHDFPEYLMENHMQLNSCVPLQCPQLHNVINSAVPRAIEQPDPFTIGVKINRLDQVRIAPAVHSDYENVLQQAGIKDIMDRTCSGSTISDGDFAEILKVVDRPDRQVSAILANALILYLGIQATTVSSVFSSGAAPARLLERLLRESGVVASYLLISATVNQLRYVNAHTHYFSTALQHMFSIGTPEMQEQIMRVLCERLQTSTPQPWGLLVLIIEMTKNSNYDILSMASVQAAPQVHARLIELVRHQRGYRSPPGTETF